MAAGAGILLGDNLGNRGRVKPLGKTLTFSDLSGSGMDASASFNELLKHAGESVELRGEYIFDSEIVVPHQVRKLLIAPGSVITIRGNHPGFTRRGTITFREQTRADMPVGATRIPVRTPSLYSEGEVLLLSGADVVPGSPDRYGYLRRIVSIDGDEIEIDQPLPRSVTQAPRTSLVTLAPSLWICGRGTVTSDSPSDMYSSLIRYIATDQPRVTDVLVTNSGATGVSISHCLGGSVDCTITDLLDDGEKHFGYGVNVSGSTRDLRVEGTIARVRHAVTTNAGPLIDGVGNAGEPEGCYFSPTVSDCSNKSVDTHRLGWGTMIVPRISGGNGGVQIRSDNATVLGGTITGCTGPGIFVSSKVAVATSIRGVDIDRLAKGQTAILCNGPADIADASITLTSGTGIELNDDSSVDGGSIAGSPAQGLVVKGSRNTVDGLQIGDGVRRKVIESKPSTANQLTPTLL